MSQNKQLALLSITALLVVSGFVAASSQQLGPGFPLDDSWIHQTYARNLADTGRWEYVPGQVSAGSTAPLWTLWLTIGYLLGLPYLWFSYLSGAICLAWLSWVAMILWRQLWPKQAGRAWVAGLTLLTTWLLVWAAASGMETLLFAALGLTILALLNDNHHRPALVGLLTGLLILTRPDGLLLLPAGAIVYLLQRRPANILLFIATAALPLIPYFAFNHATSGQWWPNTLYAKQIEYATLLTRPLPIRFSQLLYLSLGGPAEGWRGLSNAHLLLLPGLLVSGWSAIQTDWQNRRLQATLPLYWALAHTALYAWRLPVTYQHGRYLLVIIPVWLLFGLAGWGQLLAKAKEGRSGRVIRQTLPLSFALLQLLFYFTGSLAYATDVAFIQGEMVAAAHWLDDNVPAGATIAAHDIGAIGYFTQRPILDLAGLITPTVIPFLADEQALANYLLQQQPDYLVTAPGWPYHQIITATQAPLLYETNFPWTTQQNANNTAIYRLP